MTWHNFFLYFFLYFHWPSASVRSLPRGPRGRRSRKKKRKARTRMWADRQPDEFPISGLCAGTDRNLSSYYSSVTLSLSPPPEWFPDTVCLTRAYGQADRYSLERPIADFQSFSAFKLIKWQLVSIVFLFCFIRFHTASAVLLSLSLLLLYREYSWWWWQGFIGNSRCSLYQCQAGTLPHQPSVRPTSKARGHAGHGPGWGMCCKDFSPLQRKHMRGDRWLNKRQKESDEWTKDQYCHPLCRSLRCIKERGN